MTDSVSSAAAYLATTVATAVPSWDPHSALWILVVGFVVAFILAFAVGANDVANSFGTAVGSKVLTLRQACYLATVFETLGSVLLGAKVGQTIRKGIVDATIYEEMEGGTQLLMCGFLSAMLGAAIWQLIATKLKVPVSGTHSIVGSCIGFSMVAAGTNGINWAKMGMIVLSWFLSPLLSGIMAVALFWLVEKLINQQDDVIKYSRFLIPLFYASTIFINFFSILYTGAPALGLPDITILHILLVSAACAILTYVVAFFGFVPRLVRDVRKIESDEAAERSEKGIPLKVRHPGDSGYETPCDKPVQQQNRSTAVLPNSIVEGLKKAETESNMSEGKRKYSDDDEEEASLQELVSNKDATQIVTSCKDEKKDGCPSNDDDGIGGDYKGSNAPSSSSSSSGDEVAVVAGDVSADDVTEDERHESPVETRLFSSLQILTACFASFAHGGNDVSNAIGPLIALYIIFTEGSVTQTTHTPWYILLYGSVGICAGLWIMGKRVIETVGKDLTKVTSSRGFCIELMTAITVLIASNIGIPVSTTHCKVGAIVSIGMAQARQAVNWTMARNIAIAWFVTVPLSAVFSAASMWLLVTVAL